MTIETCQIDNWGQLFFVAPYWTSTLAPAMDPQNRRKTLDRLRDHLNEHQDEQKWSIEEFPKLRTLRRRKFGQLVRPFSFHQDFEDEIRELVRPEHFDGLRGRITYFDYGIGNIEVSVGIRGISREALPQLALRIEACKRRMVDELTRGLPKTYLDIEHVDRQISGFLDAHCEGTQNKLMPSYDEDVVTKKSGLICGPVSRNVLLIDSGKSAESANVPIKDIAALANKFLNETSSNSGLTGSNIIPISHVGFEGAVAVVARTNDSRDRIGKTVAAGEFTALQDLDHEVGEVKRTKTLWALAHMYWAAFYCASEGLYSILSCQTSKKKPRLSEIRSEYENLEFYQRVLSTLKFESRPEKVVVEGSDKIRYSAIWNAYDSDDLLRSLAKINDDLTANLVTLREKASRIIQNRTSSLFAIFTGLTILSLVADVITLYDVPQAITPLFRIGILLGGTSALMILAFVAAHLFSAMTTRAKKTKPSPKD